MRSSRASRSISRQTSARDLRVEAGRGLVEEQDLGAVDEAHRQVQTALRAAGVRLRLTVGGLREAEALERVAHAAAQVGARDAVALALQDEVLAAGRVGVEPVLLADDADRVADARRVGEDVEAGDARAAAVGSREGGEDADGRRLPGAVGAEQAEDGARRDG